MSSRIVVSTSKPKLPTITLEDLLEGIRKYLLHINIDYQSATFSPFYRDQYSDVQGTSFELRYLSENGVPWDDDRRIFFEIYDKACRVLTSRIGSGPFDIFLVATRLRSEGNAKCRVVADFMVEVQPDRSLAMTPRDPPREYAPNLR